MANFCGLNQPICFYFITFLCLLLAHMIIIISICGKSYSDKGKQDSIKGPECHFRIFVMKGSAFVFKASKSTGQQCKNFHFTHFHAASVNVKY